MPFDAPSCLQERMGRSKEALASTQEALDTLRLSLPDDHRDVAACKVSPAPPHPGAPHA
jgi:hypothetical protein